MSLLQQPLAFFSSGLSSQTTESPRKKSAPPPKKTMKREGCQRGALKVSRNKLLRVAAAAAAADDSEAPESVGVVVTEKAPAKLTNASKSTGKCRRLRCSGCHHHPVTKGRDKAKGAHKLRAYDVSLNHRLVSWRVVDVGGVGIPSYKGASASSLLADLAGSINSSWYEDDEDTAWSVETAADGGLSDLYDLIVGPPAGRAAAPGEADPARATDEHEGDTDKIEEQQEQDDADYGNEDEDDEAMGFCIVGIKIALGLDDWIVVDEI